MNRIFTKDDFKFNIIHMDESMCNITVQFYVEGVDFSKMNISIDLPIDENNKIPSGQALIDYIKEVTPVSQLQFLYDRFMKAPFVDMGEIAFYVNDYKNKITFNFKETEFKAPDEVINTKSLQKAMMEY
jgi:hypothetical protein